MEEVITTTATAPTTSLAPVFNGDGPPRAREGRVLPLIPAVPIVFSGPVAGAIFIEGVGWVLKSALPKLGGIIGECK